LEKGGGNGLGQSAEKGCTDPIRCYGWSWLASTSSYIYCDCQ
jgi:hypothetical protein